MFDELERNQASSAPEAGASLAFLSRAVAFRQAIEDPFSQLYAGIVYAGEEGEEAKASSSFSFASTATHPVIPARAKAYLGLSNSARPVVHAKACSRFGFLSQARSKVIAASFFSWLAQAGRTFSGVSSFSFLARAHPTIRARAQSGFSWSGRAQSSICANALGSFTFEGKAQSIFKAESKVAFRSLARARIRPRARTEFQILAQSKASIAPKARSQVYFTCFAKASIAPVGKSFLHFRAFARASFKAISRFKFRPTAKASIRPRAKAQFSILAKAKSRIRLKAKSQFSFACFVKASISPAGRSLFTFWAKARSVQNGISRFTFKATAFLELLGAPGFGFRLTVGNIDLSDRVIRWELRFNFDAGAWTLDVEFTNYEQLVREGLGLAPWDPISQYNQNGPLLGGYNEVKLWLVNGQEFLLFNGYAGPAAVDAGETWGEADTVKATFVGPSQPLKDWQIEQRLALRYTDAPIAKSAYPNDLLNRIVKDQGFAVDIQYKDEPAYYVEEYIISNVSLWAALENALAPTGFRLIEDLALDGSGIRLMVVDPLRFRTTPDFRVLRFRARRITGHEADVRTWVGVVYRDRNDFQEKLVWAESSPSIVLVYGIPDGQGGRKHKKMVYRTTDRSLVDTESEARELASIILWDLETPSPSLELEIPWLDLRFRPFQLVEVVGHNISTLMGVQDISWSWSWERPVGLTRITGCAGRVVGAKNLWFARDVRRGFNKEFQLLEDWTEEPKPGTFSRPFVAGSWFAHRDGTPKPVIDILLPEPPPWAKGVYVKIFRLKLMDSGSVLTSTKTEIKVSGKNWPSCRFSGIFSDYLAVASGDYVGVMRKIRAVSGDTILLGEELPAPLSTGTTVWIVRVARIETRSYQLTRFIRIEDVTEGEYVAVSYAWAAK